MRKLSLAFCILAVVVGLSGVSRAQWGDLSGQFIISGDAPKDMPIAPDKDVEVCGKHKLVDEWLTIGANKGVKDIVVYLYLKEGAKPPASHPMYADAAKTPVTLDNAGCRFEPRIALLLTGQQLVIGNKDSIVHNSKLDFLNNKGLNPLIPAGGSVKVDCPLVESLPSNVSCSIHSWMKAYVLVRDNPYFAVTDKEGKFTIKNVPAGKHTFQFWHETGFVQKGLKQAGKDLTWPKGRPEFEIGAKGVDLGTIEIDVKSFKKR